MKANCQKSARRSFQKELVRFATISLLLFAVCAGLQAQESSGAATFKSKCVVCHGPDGTGNTPLGKQLQAANLGSKDVQKLSNAELHKIVHDGRANMPPFADQLSDEQINQVILYVRHFAKKGK